MGIRLLWGWLLSACAACLFLLHPAQAADEGRRGPLVSAAWLQQALQRGEVLVLDASPTPMHMAGHIPGAVNADFYSYGLRDPSPEQFTARLQAWGVSPGRRIVLLDEGGSHGATRVYYDLFRAGVAPADLMLLDGGMAAWKAAGGAVTKEPTRPQPGSFRVAAFSDDVRVRLDEFLQGSGDPARHAIVDALGTEYYFGGAQFFDRAGHVPHAVATPAEHFYNADKTFKSPDEIRRMLGHLGVRPEQRIYSYCGGGVAASVPWFAMKVLLGWPQVKLYQESLLEWMQDERGLPVWTYATPSLKRDAAWVNGWTNRLMRMYGQTRHSVIDVRPAEAYALGHVPYSLNLPAQLFRSHLGNPDKLAEVLGPAGVDIAHEAVIVSDGGINPASALAFVMLERLSQKRVSLLMDSVDEWGLRGFPLTKEPTTVGARKSPQEIAIAPTSYPLRVKPGVVADAAGRGAYPTVFLAAGKAPPAKAPAGTVVHLPYGELLNADGTPKPAKDILSALDKAKLPRYAEVVVIADDPGDAAAAYVVLKLMGWPDVKVRI